MLDRIIQLLNYYLGLFPCRMKDPYVALIHAETYLIKEYSTPAMLERGFYLPEQEQAFTIIEGLRKQLIPTTYARGWVIPRGEQQ